MTVMRYPCCNKELPTDLRGAHKIICPCGHEYSSAALKEHLIQDIVRAVRTELHHARYNYPPFASPHEGFAILKEEADELWDEIKHKPLNKERMEKEAIQVAAMAIRLVLDTAP